MKLVSGSLVLGGTNTIDFNADLLPDITLQHDLGSSLQRWNQIWGLTGNIATSDRRAKKNIQPLNYGLSDLMQLRPVTYEWKNDTRNHGAQIGLIAQEVLEVIPEIVETHSFVADGRGNKSYQENELYGMVYEELIPVLIQSIQEQQAIIDDLKERIVVLENQ